VKVIKVNPEERKIGLTLLEVLEAAPQANVPKAPAVTIVPDDSVRLPAVPQPSIDLGNEATATKALDDERPSGGGLFNRMMKWISGSRKRS
jgi:hypothetical protein